MAEESASIEMREVPEGLRRRLREACWRVRSMIGEAPGEARSRRSPPIESAIPRLAPFILAGFKRAFRNATQHRDAEMVAHAIDELTTHLTPSRVA